MFKRILLLLGCILLLFIAWRSVLKITSPAEKQAALLTSADIEIGRGTFVNAVPYLTEAAKYSAAQTFEALEKLKNVYLQLGSTQEYVNVLKRQTSRADCPAAVYDEFAHYYLDQDMLTDALKIMKLGIERTNEENLINLYESRRYAYTIGSEIFEDVTAYHNGGIQVKSGGFWGLANTSGKIIIPCEYLQVSTYDLSNDGCVIAMRTDKKTVALNLSNQSTAIFETPVAKIGNLSQDIIPMQLESGKWIIADGKLVSNYTEYDRLGTPANSAVAICVSGKWGVSSLDGKSIVPYEYDEIIMDELGRCYAQNAVFAKKDDAVFLYVNGIAQAETYEDARPFSDDGWAAVKKNGKWGFINTSGEAEINYQFEDAFSFGQHLAAVRTINADADANANADKSGLEGADIEDAQTELWGYINPEGKIAIDPLFIQAKSFSNGYAPVLTELGWQFISLTEYK